MFIPGFITETGDHIYKAGFELEPRSIPSDLELDDKSNKFLIKLKDLSRGISHNKNGDEENFILYPFDFEEDIDFERAALLSLLLFPFYRYNHKTNKLQSEIYDQCEIYEALKKLN
jgi:hypothetical protein